MYRWPWALTFVDGGGLSFLSSRRDGGQLKRGRCCQSPYYLLLLYAKRGVPDDGGERRKNPKVQKVNFQHFQRRFRIQSAFAYYLSFSPPRSTGVHLPGWPPASMPGSFLIAPSQWPCVAY